MIDDPRPGWNEWALGIAAAVATRADCSRRQVGAILLNAQREIRATGYNGAPSGDPGCLTANACPRGRSDVEPGSSYDTGAGACIALHAEQNAVLQASREDQRDGILYVTHKPCDACWRMIRGTPLRAVVYPGADGEVRVATPRDRTP